MSMSSRSTLRWWDLCPYGGSWRDGTAGARTCCTCLPSPPFHFTNHLGSFSHPLSRRELFFASSQAIERDLPMMPATILNYFQRFTVDEQRSTHNKRVFAVTLSNGATLDPVTLGVPAYATAMDVDAFIEEVCRGTAPDPLLRAATLVQDLLDLAPLILSWAPTAVHASQVSFWSISPSGNII